MSDQVGEARDWLRRHGVDVSPTDAGPEGAPGRPRSESRSVGPEEADADPEDVARQIVLRKLAVQARTRFELERALQRKAVPAEAGAAVLDRMSEVGLVDDAAFARDWVASRQQRRHLSRSALRRELAGKGVDREEIDEALESVDHVDEYAAALGLAERRARSTVGLPYEVRYRRLAGVLARRGFGAGVAGRVLGEVLASSARGTRVPHEAGGA